MTSVVSSQKSKEKRLSFDLQDDKRQITDHYKILDELGRGTYAVVKKGICKKTGKEYAIKIIKKKLFSRPEFLQREIAIMKTVKHPHIVEFYDIFEDQEKVYLILQLVNGGDLFDNVTERETFSEEDAADVTRQILEALGYLHKEGIVHRDIKVDNILCEEEKDGRLHCYIADFGLSRFFSNEIQMKSKVGSLEYTAPEVFNTGGYGPGCDLWSVGVVAYILLTGTFPFSDKNPKITYEKIMNVEYDWSETPDVSDEVKDFCHRMFKKNPKERPSAEEALKHPWILGENLSSVHRTPSLQKLISIAKQRRDRPKKA